jgi:diguanylate cyclase (GGDEF)-like protein
MEREMTDRKQMVIMLMILSLVLTVLPTMFIMSFGVLNPIKTFFVIFSYTLMLSIFGLEVYDRRVKNTKQEVTALLEKEKMINGTLISINNEEKLKNVLALEIERIQYYDQSSSVIFFDVDRLGTINTFYGYHVGDQLLIEIIRMTQANIGEDDQLARIKGDTFAIILPNKPKQTAYLLAEKLHRILNQMNFGQVGRVSCRFAVLGLFKTSEEDKVIQLAYEKLAQSKAFGKGSII